MHITKTGDVSLLNDGLGVEGWEEIIRRNCLANDVHSYQIYLEALRSHALVVNRYIADRAHINNLMLPIFGYGKIDLGSLEYLRNKGYAIDTSSKEKYIESLKGALSKRENLMTRINMKRKEIENLSLQAAGSKGTERGLEQLLASLSFQVGFSIPEDVTLARFNEYGRVLREQQAQQKRHGRNK